MPSNNTIQETAKAFLSAIDHYPSKTYFLIPYNEHIVAQNRSYLLFKRGRQMESINSCCPTTLILIPQYIVTTRQSTKYISCHANLMRSYWQIWQWRMESFISILIERIWQTSVRSVLFTIVHGMGFLLSLFSLVTIHPIWIRPNCCPSENKLNAVVLLRHVSTRTLHE